MKTMHELFDGSDPELIELQKKVAQLEQHIHDYRCQAETDAGIIKSDGKEIHFLREQLAASQAVIEQMREVLDNVKGNINHERGYCDELEAEVEHALSIPTNLDALHEVRAAECERLAASGPLEVTSMWYSWLLKGAAAHRAKKGEGK